MRVENLQAAECARILDSQRIGRLACSKDGQPYVVPIFFAHADKALYAFSMPGRKIDWMRANPLVSVVVEEHGEGRSWKSVVVDGRFEELPDRIGHKVQREHAWSLLHKHANWWEPGALKPVAPSVSDHFSHVFFRILIDRLSGRKTLD